MSRAIALADAIRIIYRLRMDSMYFGSSPISDKLWSAEAYLKSELSTEMSDDRGVR